MFQLLILSDFINYLIGEENILRNRVDKNPYFLGDSWEFSDGSVVRTWCFHCYGLSFIPVRELRPHKSYSAAQSKQSVFFL